MRRRYRPSAPEVMPERAGGAARAPGGSSRASEVTSELDGGNARAPEVSTVLRRYRPSASEVTPVSGSSLRVH